MLSNPWPRPSGFATSEPGGNLNVLRERRGLWPRLFLCIIHGCFAEIGSDVVESIGCFYSRLIN